MQHYFDAALGGILYVNGFQLLSGIMYALYAVGLVRLGYAHHEAMQRGEEVKQYPTGYFTFLTIQLIPLLVTGLVIGDNYVIITRVAALGAVLFAYSLSQSEKGTFLSRRNLFWMRVAASITVSLVIIWGTSPGFRDFVRDFQPLVVWGSVVVMIVFVFTGQRAVAHELFEHFINGNYSVKRLRLQFVRFFGFAFQSLAYWYVPSKAAPVLGIDPILLQGLIGTAGVIFVLVSALVGYLLGGKERRKQKALSGAMRLVRTV